MSETPPSRTGRFGAIFVAVVVAGSAVGVLGWHLLSNRGEESMDNAGFDLEKTPEGVPPAPVAQQPEDAPQSSLGSFEEDAGIRVANGSSSAQKSGDSPSRMAQKKKEESRLGFAKAARKHEASVRGFAERMTARYPVIRQYGKDWMGYPDLKKLNDDYMRDKDPVKFLLGVSQSQNFGKMMKKYAGSPEVREFAIAAVKESPLELKAATADLLGNDRVVKDIVMNVAKGLGLPPSITGAIESADPSKVDPAKIDQSKVMTDMMNNPEMQKVMQQGQQAPAVNVGR
ncbi:MAG: hypothetical protein A2506_05175 [Elusimicrobia bacterium RIFOXYD12_FULL_66_9]|nr:MAG: hypothetical protein A2506_05175 [Elusimicrobia bacterium RIFOXYD12_FULL_66_9]